MPRVSGAAGTGRNSPTIAGGSIGDDDDVPAESGVVTLGPTVADEPFEVGERLGDGKSAAGGPEIVAEERERHLVAGTRLGPERGNGLSQLAVGVARGCDDLPAESTVAVGDELRIRHRPREVAQQPEWT